MSTFPPVGRRQFITASAALAGSAWLSGVQLHGNPQAKRSATDQVTLGKTGLQLSRLGIGTGANGGREWRELGVEKASRIIRYAFDRGITYIDTAQNYRTHELVREGIKGLPREKFFIQTKIPGNPKNPDSIIEGYLKELGTDYVDSVLVHCAQNEAWTDHLKRVIDALSAAKAKGFIRAHGVSCHGLPPLKTAAQFDWIDVHLVRINHNGRFMDGPTGKWSEPADRDEALSHITAMRKAGRGMIGMKLLGNGTFTDPADREQSIRWVFQSGLIDAAVIGLRSEEQIDEALERVNRALA